MINPLNLSSEAGQGMSSLADDFPKFLPGDQWHLDQTTGSTDSLRPASRIYTRKKLGPLCVRPSN